MSAPQEKPVVLAVKTVSPLIASSASVSKPPTTVKKVVKVPSTLSSTATAAPKKVIKKVAVAGAPVVKRKLDSTGKPVSAAVKKPKVVVSSTPGSSAPKKVVKKIAGDDCKSDEERSEDGSDDGSDLKGFLVDEEDDEDGYSEEDESKKVEQESFSSVDDYRREMEAVLALLGSRATRQKYVAKNPSVLMGDTKPKKQ